MQLEHLLLQLGHHHVILLSIKVIRLLSVTKWLVRRPGVGREWWMQELHELVGIHVQGLALLMQSVIVDLQILLNRPVILVRRAVEAGVDALPVCIVAFRLITVAHLY